MGYCIAFYSRMDLTWLCTALFPIAAYRYRLLSLIAHHDNDPISVASTNRCAYRHDGKLDFFEIMGIWPEWENGNHGSIIRPSVYGKVCL